MGRYSKEQVEEAMTDPLWERVRSHAREGAASHRRLRERALSRAMASAVAADRLMPVRRPAYVFAAVAACAVALCVAIAGLAMSNRGTKTPQIAKSEATGQSTGWHIAESKAGTTAQGAVRIPGTIRATEPGRWIADQGGLKIVKNTARRRSVRQKSSHSG